MHGMADDLARSSPRYFATICLGLVQGLGIWRYSSSWSCALRPRVNPNRLLRSRRQTQPRPRQRLLQIRPDPALFAAPSSTKMEPWSRMRKLSWSQQDLPSWNRHPTTAAISNSRACPPAPSSFRSQLPDSRPKQQQAFYSPERTT